MAGLNGTYSFLDIQAAISGPGGDFDLGASGVSEEGITITMTSDKNAMAIGANGDGMHSLRAGEAGRITISLLKTAPGNSQLNKLYNHQKQSSGYWGQNQLTITNPVSGDRIVATEGAFVRHADIGYRTEGGMNVWTFDFIDIDKTLGNNYRDGGI